jgi:hypothetical protein
MPVKKKTSLASPPLLPTVKKEFVISTTKSPAGNVIMIGDLKATESQINDLKAEAATFRNTLLYQVLIATPKKQAMDAIFYNSNSLEDLTIGKTMLRTLDVMENVLKLLE